MSETGILQKFKLQMKYIFLLTNMQMLLTEELKLLITLNEMEIFDKEHKKYKRYEIELDNTYIMFNNEYKRLKKILTNIKYIEECARLEKNVG